MSCVVETELRPSNETLPSSSLTAKSRLFLELHDQRLCATKAGVRRSTKLANFLGVV